MELFDSHRIARFARQTGCLGILMGLVFFSQSSHAEIKVQARLDCLSLVGANQGSRQACLNFSQLAIKMSQETAEGLKAEIQLDPFGTPYAPFAALPRIDDLAIPLNTETPLNFIDSFALRWQFRDNLTLSVEQVSGPALLPNSSGLAFGSRFQDIGWDQTAITALYKLPPLNGVDVRLIIGNGEGENGQNLDPQQFGGLEINASLLEGVYLKLGMSYDGNNLGSQRFQWLYGESPASLGFSTERQAVVLGLDGKRPGLRGLVASLAWQRSKISDLDRNQNAVPTNSPFSEERAYDVNFLLVESPEKANQIQRTVINFGLSYRILAVYMIGFDYDQRTIHTDAVEAFEICRQIDQGNCIDAEGRSNRLKQTSYTVGIGKDLVEDALNFTIEYNSTHYDRLYRYFNYRADQGQKRKSFEAVNARLSYQW